MVWVEVYEEIYFLDYFRIICIEFKCKDKVCYDRCSNMEMVFGLFDLVGKFLFVRDIVFEFIDSVLLVFIFSIIFKYLFLVIILVFLNLGVEDVNGDVIFCNKLFFRFGKCRICDCFNIMYICESLVWRIVICLVVDEDI